MLFAELPFTTGELHWVWFGVELAVYTGVVVLFALYPILLFVRQVWRAVR
jgi:hypothetical protein